LAALLSHIFPIAQTLRSYNLSDARSDLVAGVTVGVMLIPQGMAYALIAGLPPEYGLYAALVPLIIYAFMGTSRHLAVGPVALVALLIASAVAPLATTPEEYIAYSILLALMVGLIQILLGLLRLGFLVNLLSHPVLSGFISAAAIYIGLSQLHHLLGVSSVSGGLHQIIAGIGLQLGEAHLITIITGIAAIALILGLKLTHLITIITGIAAIALILGLKKIAPKIPGPVAAVVLGIVVMYLAGLENAGVALVGTIPSGLPGFVMPELSQQVVINLLPMASAIALVAYMEAIAVAKAIQHKSRNYTIDPNQELIALGASNAVGSFFQSFPGTGSFSRSAVTYQNGGKTNLSGLIAAGVIALSLLLLTPIFYYLPDAVLAAIIITAVFGLIEFDQFKRLWKLGHYDRYLFLATFAGTLFLGIKEGILLGVILSVIMLVYRSARPNHSILGRIPETDIYRNVDRYETERDEGILVFRFDAPLHFANAEYFHDEVEKLSRREPGLTCLILDLNGVNDIDATGLETLRELVEEVQKRGINVLLAEVKSPVRDLLKKDAPETINWKFYMTIRDAVSASKADAEDELSLHIHTDI